MDVAVDLRAGSPTFGRWDAVELDDENMRSLYVPIGFAHGFCVTSDVADVVYKQSAYYDPAVERGIAWDDPEIAIGWPLPAGELTVSERDGAAPRLAEWRTNCRFGGILSRHAARLQRLSERTNGYTVTPAAYLRSRGRA